jgi:hypothetical protein
MRLLPIILSILVVAACDVSVRSTPPPPVVQPVDPGPAIDTDALLAAAGARDGQVVHVTGFVLIGEGARLCSVVLESYPPQCGGGTVALTGTFPADVVAALEKTDDPTLAQATWGWVDVLGTFSLADGPTIEIDRISVVAP